MSRNLIYLLIEFLFSLVTPRERRVSRNHQEVCDSYFRTVTPRERRVSRNQPIGNALNAVDVTPRERRVSRNKPRLCGSELVSGHASREACE